MIEKALSDGRVSYALRFRAYGERRFVQLGYSSEGWTRQRADDELANLMADVRRGLWQPWAAPEEPAPVPTFHVFASEWLAARRHDGLRPKSIEYLEWALTTHLLPAFKDTTIDEFTVELIDRYSRAKASRQADARKKIARLQVELAERERMRRPTRLVEDQLRAAQASPGLSNRSINKTLDVLSEVLETAVEYGHLSKNPARGKRRRLPVSKVQRSFLDTAEHIVALLDGAAAIDAAAFQRRGQRRALLATLTFAGLRIGEALDLRWRDVNLADGKLRVRESKTAAGVRVVDVLPVLRDELVAYKAQVRDLQPDGLVFATTTGGRQSETNVRRRVLAKAVEIANEQLEAGGAERLPEGLTPHSLRRTFASILAALGEPMPSVIRQLGHADPALTLRIYAHDVARGDAERERLRALVNGHPLGTGGVRPAAVKQVAAPR